jgi:hypothetical protein
MPRRPDNHNVHLGAHQLDDQLGVDLGLAVSVSVFNGNVLAVDVAEIAEPLPECRDVRLVWRRRFRWDQHADPGDLLRRLRLAGKRPGEEAEGDRADERATVHYSIT